MSKNKRLATAQTGMIIGTMIGLIVITLLFKLTWPASITRGATLPPPAPPTPSNPAGNTSDDDDDGGSRTPLLAAIQLSVSGASSGAWSVVQWQDSDGNWHDVEGWRNALSGSGQRWVVMAKDFKTGPFRWVVRQGESGSQLGVSNPFQMPSGANETVFVSVSVP